MLQQGLSEMAANAAGLMALSRQVGLAAAVRGFDDCFFLATFVTVAGLIPTIWLKRGLKTHGEAGEPMILD